MVWYGIMYVLYFIDVCVYIYIEREREELYRHILPITQTPHISLFFSTGLGPRGFPLL